MNVLNIKWTIIQFTRYDSLNGPSYFKAVITISFSLCLFVLILIARVWSKKSFSKISDIDQLSNVSFHILNTYFFFYYFIYAMFASVQVNF
jgi:hypothetical protein